MNKKIDVRITEEELQELREGKEFDWTYGDVEVHISSKEEGDE